MKEKDCKIVQDLLPNYIEKLTNEETNAYIEEHLNTCDKCKKVYENMKKDIELNKNKKDNREVKYIKKYSNKMKILKAILLAILTIYIMIIARRMIILYTIEKKERENFNYTNYYVKTYSYSTGRLRMTESYHKDGNYLMKATNENQKITCYKNNDDFVALIETPQTRRVNKNMIVAIKKPRQPSNIIKLFVESHFNTISSGYCNGKECYIINNATLNIECYYDKETGICIREVWKASREYSNIDSRTDYEYTFDTVKDSDIVKPELYGNEKEMEW